jgi:phosphomannomutase
VSLIASVSGIRGTIGGKSGINLSPVDLVKYSSAYARLLKQKSTRPKVVIGRDGRISGQMVSDLVSSTLQAMGIDIVQTGLSTTPTVEMAVTHHNADGGIILSASHNPKEWNALKLLNSKGEFISADEGNQILQWVIENQFEFNDIHNLGSIVEDSGSIRRHIDKILELPAVCVDLIRLKNYNVVADCINSTAALALPVLFDALQVRYKLLNKEINGDFAHNPEPLPENLEELIQATKNSFDIGIAVDPDVDRLALVDEHGNYFGEEYTLVSVADYLLGIKSGNTVSNLSSSRALKDITLRHGGQYYASAVGEVHVVKKMKEVHSVIGGEGNGGIIYPDLHYGRDALVGIALILSNMASKNQSLSQLKKSYPQYVMHKDKIQLNEDLDFARLLQYLTDAYKLEKINLEDGIKIDFKNAWLHLRKSNTEPIVRIYSEATNLNEARSLCEQIKSKILQFQS